MANRGHVKNLLRRLSELCDKNPEIEGLILEVLSEKLHVTQDNGKSGVLTALGGIRTLMGVEDLSPSDIISIKKHVPPQVSSQVPKTESKL